MQIELIQDPQDFKDSMNKHPKFSTWIYERFDSDFDHIPKEVMEDGGFGEDLRKKIRDAKSEEEQRIH